MNASAHLRGIVIAGALAALALALGLVTLAMNQTASKASVHVVLPLRHHATAATSKLAASAAAAKPKATKVDPNLTAALSAGLPRVVARALAAAPVAVVELTSKSDPVAQLSAAEAESGAAFAGASYVEVDVDRNGDPVDALTRLLGALPQAPATLVYERPAKLFITLNGFNDRTVVEQAVANAAPTATGPGALAAATDWPSRAGVLCTEAYQQLARLGGLGRPTALAAHKVQFEAVVTGFLAQFVALEAPAAEAADVKQLNVLLARAFAAEDALVAAASRHDAAALAAGRTRADKLFVQAGALEQKLGATACVESAA